MAHMAQGTLRLPDPEPEPSLAPPVQPRDRRRLVRQKVHSPVYASFNGPQASMVVDLSELLDLHEEGFAVQTGEMLEVNRPVALTLDLPETRTFIHGSGQVVWSDPSGRVGMRFSALPESSRRLLREWLFANLLIACSNQAARSEQLSRQTEEPEEIPREPLPSTESSSATQDLSGMLSAVDAVRREIYEAGADRDAVFQFIIAHALRLTGADGAALAFLTHGNMICRARAGEPAPPVGALVDRKQGLSGECVRSAMIVGCQDTENDSRVDPEVCRALGIGSMLAVPMFSGFRVVGLLQVFSPHPRSFTKAHATVLERLVEALPEEHPEAPLLQDAATAEMLPPSSEPASLTPSILEALLQPEPEAKAGTEPQRVRPSSRLQLGLMALVLAIVALALGYLLAPSIERRGSGVNARAANRPAAVSSQNAARNSKDEDSPEALRKRADAGEADAQWRMGARYHEGDGVRQDDTQAVQWFLRAAQQGHVGAQATLGAYYWAGRGVPPDLSRAYFWSTLAFARGDETSKSRLEGLASQMTRSQIAAARQQADIWLRQHNAAKQAK
ncbi:MAG TPA: GAF domain-containing protein [Terriglobales bacterium]|nr:GAF domain-containing protein [Terriglobales bacterium]